jgi:hypothetical protein
MIHSAAAPGRSVKQGMITKIGLAIIGFAVWCAPAPAQDGSSSELALKQMRKALIGDSPLSDLSNRIEEIRKATLAKILRILNSTTLSTNDIDTEIRGMDKDYWAKPASILRKDLAGTNVIVVAYAILHGGAAIPAATPVIEAFRDAGHLYQEVGHSGGNLEDTAARLEELASPWPTELWIFAHGQQTQVMQYHESAAILSFDGFRLKELWVTKAPLKDPNFQITKEALLITYEDEEQIGPALVKTLALTPGGVLETGTASKTP